MHFNAHVFGLKKWIGLEYAHGWLNIIYSTVKSVNLGIEYVYGERETFENLKGIDNRFNVMMSYDF